ncbi:hypothetical protein EMIT047CA2_240033 [Pseudomonas soli]
MDAPFRSERASGNVCDPPSRGRPWRRPGRLKDDLVDGVFQALASFEARNLGGSDLDRLTGLRVTAGALCALLDREGAEANQDNIVTGFQGALNGFDHCVQRTAGYSFRDVSGCGDSVNQFRLVHSKSPYFSIEFVSKYVMKSL